MRRLQLGAGVARRHARLAGCAIGLRAEDRKRHPLNALIQRLKITCIQLKDRRSFHPETGFNGYPLAKRWHKRRPMVMMPTVFQKFELIPLHDPIRSESVRNKKVVQFPCLRHPLSTNRVRPAPAIKAWAWASSARSGFHRSQRPGFHASAHSSPLDAWLPAFVPQLECQRGSHHCHFGRGCNRPTPTPRVHAALLHE